MNTRTNEIEAESATRHANAGERVLKVPLDKLVPSPTNPRKHFDPAAIKELAEDLKASGQTQPIVCRAHPKREGFFEIIVGERRYRAAKEAQFPTLDVIHREMNDFEVIKRQYGENHKRKDIGAIEEAQAFADMKRLGNLKNNDEIAKHAGVSKETVYNRLKLLELCDEGKKLLAAGEIQPIQATHIARLTHGDQMKAIKACVSETLEVEDVKTGRTKQERRTMSVRELQVWISQNLQIDLKRAYFDPEDAKLFPAAGKCSGCPFNTACPGNLFPDAQGRAICTKTDCFEKKTLAALEIRFAELSKDGKKVLKIGSGNFNKKDQLPGVKYDRTYPPRAGASSREQFKYSRENCKSEVRGLIVHRDTYSSHNLGEAPKICVDKQCKSCWSQWERPSEPAKKQSPAEAKAAKAKQKAKEDKQKLTASVKLARLKAVFDAVPVALSGELLRECVRQVSNMWFDDDVWKAMGMRSVGWGNGERVIKSAKDRDLIRFIIAQALRDAGDKSVIENFAKILKVDLEAIETKVRAELTPKPKEAKGKAKDEDEDDPDCVPATEIAKRVRAAGKTKGKLLPKAKKK